MEYTKNFLLNKIDKIEDKLKRIEEILSLTEIHPNVKLTMITSVVEEQ